MFGVSVVKLSRWDSAINPVPQLTLLGTLSLPVNQEDSGGEC